MLLIISQPIHDFIPYGWVIFHCVCLYVYCLLSISVISFYAFNHHHKTVYNCVCVCSVVSNFLWPRGLPGFCLWNFPARNLEQVAISLLPGNLPQPGVKLQPSVRLLHWQVVALLLMPPRIHSCAFLHFRNEEIVREVKSLTRFCQRGIGRALIGTHTSLIWKSVF